MIKNLKQSFFQVFAVTSVWITLLLTIFFNGQTIALNYLWNLIGISAIFALLFGVIYSGLWNYLTLKPITNILITSILNIVGGLTSVWLFSSEMFYFIAPWIPGMLVLSLVLHILAFYVYAKIDAKKKAEELNDLVKNKQ
ncbi:hypothetical protein [Acetobacterium sp.]|jgi:FlaA1/EpsC-like NDP-sugar epimerase|uniref:hypothetical protein n=1 Tax=Acetobacterium sp. TaxID=1872094 RepID=UPI000CBB3C91|nr:hypothetical protein [Acetobacterium sp.]MDO9491026.1 hypothetical protein [Acetobacterium sp.]PKM74866.1 MAG: hypothetical protein CVU92_04295 [Firmicutes bacterium HGW-Firmicutes-17]